MNDYFEQEFDDLVKRIRKIDSAKVYICELWENPKSDTALTNKDIFEEIDKHIDEKLSEASKSEERIKSEKRIQDFERRLDRLEELIEKFLIKLIQE